MSQSLEEMQPFIKRQMADYEKKVAAVGDRRARINAQFQEILADDKWLTYQKTVAVVSTAKQQIVDVGTKRLVNELLDSQEYIKVKIMVAQAEAWVNCCAMLIDLVTKAQVEQRLNNED